MMAGRIKWTDRTFRFDFPVALHPEIVVRFAGSAVRAEELVRGVAADVLVASDGKGWSIQQNIGHLLDLESLIAARLDQFEAGLAMLKAADMKNAATNEANHNGRAIGELIAEFKRERAALTARLDAYPAEFFGRSAIHPRLNMAMRVVDLVWFSAEHDDYHLARVVDLKRALAG